MAVPVSISSAFCEAANLDALRAAFFDLDRTVIARSSALALAGAFRQSGLLSRNQLLRAALLQIRFSRFGASEDKGREMAERGMAVLDGVEVTRVREIVAAALEPALKPLVYRGALQLVGRHRERGERTYLVSAALDEVVAQLAAELGFDGSLGSTCGSTDGVFSGRPEFLCYGTSKAEALRSLAVGESLDLSVSTAYSDSHTDLPFLEAVGRPVAVNPDRELRRVATARAWPIVRFRARAFA